MGRFLFPIQFGQGFNAFLLNGMLICVQQALLDWMEADQASRPQGASLCQSVPQFTKPTAAFHTSKLWLCRCLDILGKKHDL